MSLNTLKANPFLAKALEAKATPEKPAEEKAHVIYPKMGVTEEGNVVITFPLEELAKARPSRVKIAEDGKTTGGKHLVFGFGKTTFEIDGTRFFMGSGYHTFGPER